MNNDDTNTLHIIEWLRDQAWSGFAVSLVGKFERFGKLTDRQLASAYSMREKCEAREVTRPAVPEVGFYFIEGEGFYRVQEIKCGGRFYAKHCVDGEWKYVGRTPFPKLTADRFVTREQASEFGHQFGRCLICGLELTDPVSVANGIGPVCTKKQGWVREKRVPLSDVTDMDEGTVQDMLTYEATA